MSSGLYEPIFKTFFTIRLDLGSCLNKHVVKGVLCRQAKDATASFAYAKDAKGNLQPTIYVYKKD